MILTLDAPPLASAAALQPKRCASLPVLSARCIGLLRCSGPVLAMTDVGSTRDQKANATSSKFRQQLLKSRRDFATQNAIRLTGYPVTFPLLLSAGMRVF